jgi:hypothetical protein
MNLIYLEPSVYRKLELYALLNNTKNKTDPLPKYLVAINRVRSFIYGNYKYIPKENKFNAVSKDIATLLISGILI